MPAPASNRKIKDFFKPFSIPRSQIPVNEVVEEEIVVAARPPRSSSQDVKPDDASPTTSTSKRDSARGSSTEPSSSSNVLSPSRALPIGTPRKKAPPSQIVGAGDRPNSPISTQTRTLEAAETLPPRGPSPPSHASAPVPFTSFSSVSTLSSVPMSSASSSRRIIKDGIKAVTNSDSGSADSDSDQLADPMTFIPCKKRRLTPPGQDAEHAIKIVDSATTVRQSGRFSDVRGRSDAAVKLRLPPSPPKNVYKHSLMKLVKQREKEEKTASRIRDAEAAFEEAQKEREERVRQDQNISSGLKAATADDSDEGDRMMLAMQRTEALQEDEKFYFFRNGVRAVRKEFPSLLDSCCDGLSKPWIKLLQDQKSRNHAFLSGFVADIASTGALPSLLTSWIENELIFEPRTHLCEAYVEVLQADVSRSGEVPRLGYYYNTLQNLRENGVDEQAAIPTDPPPGLTYMLQLLQRLRMTQEMSVTATPAVLMDLALAQIDEHIIRSVSLVNEIHDTLESVLDAIPTDESFEMVCKAVHQDFFARSYLSQHLQCQAISSLPAISDRTHHLRRLLALHLIANLTSGKDYRRDLTSPGWVAIIKIRVESAAEFNISLTTSYSLLHSLIEVLDIAIDAGFSGGVSDASIPLPTKTQMLMGKSSTPSTAESRFNSHIDTLTYHLRSMPSQIRGSGTSHLRRTEAKSSLERLIMRLEHSVRTRPKPRNGVFGGSTSDQRDFLSSFLKPIATTREDNNAFSMVPADMLSDREVSDDNQTSGEVSAVSGAEST